jgi:hypothetical protein
MELLSSRRENRDFQNRLSSDSRFSFYRFRFHTLGAKRKSTGKISSLPSSISKESRSLDRLEKNA